MGRALGRPLLFSRTLPQPSFLLAFQSVMRKKSFLRRKSAYCFVAAERERGEGES